MKKASSKRSISRPTPKKRSFFNSTNVQWFRIDIHHIALGVSFIGCIVALLLVQKQKTIEEQVLAAQTTTGAAVPVVRVGGIPICEGGNCANITPIPRLTCIPRPACLNLPHPCMIAEPAEGWCPQTNGTPIPQVTLPVTKLTPPQGCYYKTICYAMGRMCPFNDSNCNSGCRQLLICPSITITPPIHPSCTPVPSCNPKLGIACRAFEPCAQPSPKITCIARPLCTHGICPNLNPNIEWCMPQISAPSSGQASPSGQQFPGNGNANPVTQFFTDFVKKFFPWL